MSSGSDDVKQLQVRLAGDQPAASAERPWDQLQQVLFSSETAARSVVPQAAESNRLQQASLEESLASNRRAVAKDTMQSTGEQQTNTAAAAWIHSTAPIWSRQTQKSREWWPKYHNPQMLLIRQPHLNGAALAQQPTSGNAGAMLTLDLRALAASHPEAAASPLLQAPATCEAPVPENSAPWPSADTHSLPSLSGNIPSAPPAPTLSIRPGSAASVGSPAPATPGRALYSMVLLNASSRQRLLERVPPAFQRVSADHMTICYKPDQAHLDGLLIGSTARLAAVGIARDDNRQAVAVEVLDPGIDVSAQPPHVTISTGQRASAKSAGSLLESCQADPGVRQACYAPLEPALLLQGTVCLKLTNGSTVFSKESGTLLPSKTNSARRASAPSVVGRKGRENSEAGDSRQGWKRQGIGEEPHRTVVLQQQEYRAPAKSQHFGEEELNGAGATASPSATPTDESSRSPAQPHGQEQQPAPASQPRPDLSSAAAKDRGGRGAAASGHDSSYLDELLGKLGISRQLLGGSGGAAVPPVADAAAQQGPGGTIGSAARHKLGRPADSSSAEQSAEGGQLPELEALLRAWNLGSSSDAASQPQALSTKEQADCSQCFSPEQPTVARGSTAHAAVPITPAAAAAGISEKVFDELESGAAAAAEDAEFSFWEQLMAGAGTEATERPQSSEQNASSASRHDSACGNDSRASKQGTGESSKSGKRSNAAANLRIGSPGTPGHVPLQPKRPGKEAIDRLWCSGRKPPDDSGAATESTSSPQLLPAKLLRRGEAPGDRPLPSKPTGDRREVPADSSTVPTGTAEIEREEPSRLSNSQDCILDQPRQPVAFKISRPSQTSSKVASASRRMVMFMEEHPDSPAADVGRAAERLADELVGQVYELPAEAFADSDVEEEEEDVTGDPWWAARKLPSKLPETAGKLSAAPDGEGRSPASAVAAHSMNPGKAASKIGPKRKKPKSVSRSPAAQTSDGLDLVSSMMDVWHLAGKAREGPSSEAGDGPGHAAQELPRRQILTLPKGAFQRDSDWRPAAKAQTDQHQRQSEHAMAPRKSKDEANKNSEGSCTPLAALGPICLTPAGLGNLEAGQEGPADDLGAEGLSDGVGQLLAKFPSIDRTVAHLTLESHRGDVEEAISFLELTALTATPGQLTQLGLLPARELFTPIRVLQPAANGASSGDRGQAALPPASEPASVAAVDGSLADRVLAAADPGEAIELAISGASITLAERQRLQAESDEARRRWERHYQAKGILNEAAAAAEAKGQRAVAQLLRAQAYEQGRLGAQWRQQCNDRAFAGSNHGNTNTVKVDLHGMSVDEAIAKLEQHVHSLSGLSSATFILQVITGAGKHSLGGIARLQPAVIDYARTRGLRWGREPGNAGQINVTLSGVQQT